MWYFLRQYDKLSLQLYHPDNIGNKKSKAQFKKSVKISLICVICGQKLTPNSETLNPEISDSYEKYFDKLSMTSVYTIVL